MSLKFVTADVQLEKEKAGLASSVKQTQFQLHEILKIPLYQSGNCLHLWSLYCVWCVFALWMGQRCVGTAGALKSWSQAFRKLWKDIRLPYIFNEYNQQKKTKTAKWEKYKDWEMYRVKEAKRRGRQVKVTVKKKKEKVTDIVERGQQERGKQCM